MDKIAERANLTKRTIYQHFRSKDDLIAATLAHASALALDRLENIKLPASRDAMIDSLFSQIAGLGCNAAMVGRRLHACRR
jgi:AcrR family transcriptional regulator